MNTIMFPVGLFLKLFKKNRSVLCRVCFLTKNAGVAGFSSNPIFLYFMAEKNPKDVLQVVGDNLQSPSNEAACFFMCCKNAESSVISSHHVLPSKISVTSGASFFKGHTQ